MAEFDEKLNAILGNQEAMAQIMSLARSLSADGPGENQNREDRQAGEPDGEDEIHPEGQSAQPDLSAMLGQLDPALLRTGMEVIRQVQSTEDRNAALLQALRPFLREERRGRLDRAIQIARMTRMIRAAITALGERGQEEGV